MVEELPVNVKAHKKPRMRKEERNQKRERLLESIEVVLPTRLLWHTIGWNRYSKFGMSGQLLAAPLSFSLSFFLWARPHRNTWIMHLNAAFHPTPWEAGRVGVVLYFSNIPKRDGQWRRFSRFFFFWEFFAAKYVKMSLHNFWYEWKKIVNF